MECQYCNKILSSKSSLLLHQRKTKYCLKIQGKVTKGEFNCEYCGQNFTYKSALQSHYQSCSANKPYVRESLRNCQNYEIKNKELKKRIILLEKDKLDLQERYDKLAETLAKQPLYQEVQQAAVIEIEPEDESEDSDNEEDDEKKEYELVPLDLGKGYEIEHREEDGYINVSNLCKAGGKQFKAWNRLQKTKAFLQVLSQQVLIHTTSLIQTKQDNQYDKQTWVHPQVAINIAQWVSPKFDVKVSAWIYEVMMTGKVDITNTKSYRKLQEENKGQKIKIQHLTKKYMKKQPRLEIKETNVVYILTTKLMKKERRYILGKATNLTNRLSTYNKSDEHQIVYYQGCGDEDNMSTVETLVFQKLKSYREQANRERFVLPEDKEISLFIDTIKECVSFVTK
jgi:hypothetical protein